MKKRLLATIPVLLVVFLCSYNVHAEVSPYVYSKNGVTMNYSDNEGNPTGTLTVNLTSYVGELSGSSNIVTSALYGNGSWQPTSANLHYYSMHNIFTVRLSNNTNKYAIADLGSFSIDVYTGVNNFFGQMGFYGHFENISGNFAPRFTLNTISSGRDTCTVYWENESALVLEPNETKIYYFDLVFDFNDNAIMSGYNAQNLSLIRNANSSITWTRYPTSFTRYTISQFMANNNYPNSVIAYLDAIQIRLKNFFDSYNANLNNSADVTTGSTSLETQSDTIHSQETGYYTQTNTALANTGLSNYQFSSDVVGGMGIVKDQFTYVWNKLGNYNVVYIFSLTLSIALMIIRHVRPIRRKQEE